MLVVGWGPSMLMISDVGFPGTVDVFRPLDKKLCYSEVTLRKMSGL